MDQSFVSLLNDGSYNGSDDFNYSPSPPLSQVNDSQQVQSKPKKGRSKNFLIEEDMLLLSGWFNISTDPVQGNNQTQMTYWNRIWTYFHENKTFVSDRSPTLLCNRWSAINTSVSKFVGFYNHICGRNESGKTEQNKIEEAISMYDKIMKEKFPFLVHWYELRNSPKYAATLAKKNKSTMKESNTSSPSAESPISSTHCGESEDTIESPIENKAAKKLKRAAYEATDAESLHILKSMQKDAEDVATSRSESISMSLQLQKEMLQLQKEEQDRQAELIILQKEKMHLRLAKEERERQKEEREKQVYEASIMAIDTSNMLPDQAKYYEVLKAKILKNMS